MDHLNQKSKIKNQKLLSLWDIGKRYWVTLVLVIIILAAFLLMIGSARSDSMVVDEEIHISAGYLHIWQGDYTFNSEHPPLLNDLAGLFAKIARPNLPNVDLHQYQGGDQWTYGDLFFYRSGPEGDPFGGNNVDKIVFWARFPFILLTLGLIYLVFIWAKAVFSPKAGLLAATLTAFSPNILAHGHLATTDIGLVFFFVLAVWLLRKYLLSPSWKNAFILAVATAFAILAKFSGMAILPIVFLGFIYLGISKKIKFTDILGHFFLTIIIVFILGWLLYAFSARDTLAGNFLMAPIDKFIQGYKILTDHNSAGHWNFLNGQVNTIGWWYYFPLVLWYKLTVPVLLLLALAVVFGRYKMKQAGGYQEKFLIIFPPLLFLGISMTSKIDIGIRHILPILPLLFIFISQLANTKNFILKPIVAGLVILHIGVGILAYPNYIAYFNQIAGGSRGGINHLVDSNLDWNQNMKRLAKYYQEQNLNKVYEYCWNGYAFSYYGMNAEFLPASPVDGVVVVCAHQLKFYQAYGYDISWVTKYLPDDIVADGIYIWRFDLPANR